MDGNVMNCIDRQSRSLIPDANELADFLEVESCVPQSQLIVSQMLDPLRDALSTGGKKIRFEMIEMAFQSLGGVLNEEQKRRLKVCEQIIEGLHLGSMIIDDIQDQSKVRRGRPTFHRKYGVDVAINAGNWLYFQAIQQIQFLGLEPNPEIILNRRLNEVLIKAHFGQGIDVGVNMNTLPQNLVESVYFTAVELKTGALMALAFELGAAVAGVGAKDESQKIFLKLVKKFGIALQILDDIGNFLAPPPKGKEDLKIGRPSFPWVMAAKLATSSDYERFKYATRMLPDTSFLDSWSNIFDLIPHAKSYGHEYLDRLKNDFLEWISTSILRGLGQPGRASPEELIDQVDRLFSKLEKAYE